MSDGSASPHVEPVASPGVQPAPARPGRGVVLLGSAAIAVAATAGAVFGFAWSGGGVPAGAQPPMAAPMAAPVAATASPALARAGLGAAGTFADIVERVSPAVVSIRAKVTAPAQPEISDDDLEGLPPGLRDYFERFRQGGPERPRNRGEVQGSGFVVEPNGLMITNNHVISNASEIQVTFSDSKTYKARVIGRDEATDIAVLKIEGGRNFPTVSFGDDTKVRVGDWVLAVGNPFGLGGTVTAGIVSARGRDDVGGAQFTDFIQIDASINRGNSGGPTFDLSGRVIGMNTAIFSPSGGSVGIGFAIPSSTIQRIVSDLKSTGSVTRGWLGVQIQSLNEDAAASLGLPNTNGAIVAQVIERSPAEKAGFRAGDVVIRMDGVPVRDNRDLSRRVAALQVNQSARFVIWRDNRETTLSVTVAKRPDPQTLAERSGSEDGSEGPSRPGGGAKVSALGLDLATITPALRSSLRLDAGAEGVVITDVDRNSDAAEQGLQPGDRIIQASGKDIRSVSDVTAVVAAAKTMKRPSVLLFIERGKNQRVFVPVKLGRG